MDDRIVVRSTIHLRGLQPGREALVDPDDPYIAACLRGGLLVAVATAPLLTFDGDAVDDVGETSDGGILDDESENASEEDHGS